MQGKWYNIKLNPLVVYFIAFFFFSSTQQSIRQINKSRIKDYICENLQRLLPLPAQTHSMRNIQRFVMPLMNLCDPWHCFLPPSGIKFRYFRKGNIYIYNVCVCIYIYIYIYISGGPLSALTCCVNVRLLSAIKKISPLIYSQSWVGSWVYTTQAMMTFNPDILARMYT